jgi:two-component system, LytTR family, sensor kinase
MKKSFFFFLLFALSIQSAFTQVDFNALSTSYLGIGDRKGNLPFLMTAEQEVNNAFWPAGANRGIDPGAGDPSFYKNRVKEFYSTETYDSSDVHFFSPGIYPHNTHLYEFRVTQDGKKVITPWSAVSQFTKKGNTVGGGTDPMGYLGGYKTSEGSYVVVDLRKKGSDSIFAFTVVYHRSLKPRIADIYLSGELNSFFKRLSNTWQYEQSDTTLRRWTRRYPANEIDPATSLPKKLEVPYTENDLIFFINARINKKDVVEYQLEKDGAIAVSWKPNDFDNGFIWLQHLSPGDYVLKIRYTIQRHNVTTYPFRIKPAWHQTAFFKIIAGSLIAAFFGFIILLFRLRTQKKKMREEASRKAKLQLELKAIRSQLNPHFIFNALNSIQGLINKNDIAAANRYLSEFGNLVRNSLTGSDKDFTTLHEEVANLETYLKLEQLRFGFQYNIQVDGPVDAFSTDIPSLLLQPLAENAVKHGVSDIHEKGRIDITFAKKNKDMVVHIRNNGHGFTTHPPVKGYGLKLTGDRVELLNEILKEQSIQWTINSTDQETDVQIVFKNWLS